MLQLGNNNCNKRKLKKTVSQATRMPQIEFSMILSWSWRLPTSLLFPSGQQEVPSRCWEVWMNGYFYGLLIWFFIVRFVPDISWSIFCWELTVKVPFFRILVDWTLETANMNNLAQSKRVRLEWKLTPLLQGACTGKLDSVLHLPRHRLTAITIIHVNRRDYSDPNFIT